MLTWQSVVDASVGTAGVADALYARLPADKHRLVTFDVNRKPELRSVQRPTAAALIDRLRMGSRRYTLDIVSSADSAGGQVDRLRLAPDGTTTSIDTGLTWPGGLVSLSHVALPFPPDDPVYGFIPGSGRNGVPSIGSWLVRGETGSTTIALGSLTRLRSNPFWSLIAQDVAALVAVDLARKGN